MKGYGFGVWLVPKSNISSIFMHIPHVTIMCNMTEKDAKSLCELLNDYQKSKRVHAYIDGKCSMLPNNYENDPLFGSGFDVHYNELKDFKLITTGFKGDFSFFPHLTYNYSCSKKAVKIQDIDPVIVECDICVADITDDLPQRWRILF